MHRPETPRSRRHSRSLVSLSLLLAALSLHLAPSAYAVQRTCTFDAIANTADVLCAPPSGPCNATTVVMSTSIEITGPVTRCRFDLGGRNLVVDRTLSVGGRLDAFTGRAEFENAGNVTVTERGRLKARGDEGTSSPFVGPGGKIEIESFGWIVVDGLIDVSGDSAGDIELDALDDITLGPTGLLRANGLSTILEEGERFADGGTVEFESARNAALHGVVRARGQSTATGGDLVVIAARDTLLAGPVDVSGGDGGGGTVDVIAGDHVRVTHTIEADGRSGTGSGGQIVLEGGTDDSGDLTPGGSIALHGASLSMQASGVDESGGDGGDLDVTVVGNLTMTDTLVRTSAAPAYDGAGGFFFVDATAPLPAGDPALTGAVHLEGVITMRGGADGASGGALGVFAEGDVVVRADIDLRGADSGELEIESQTDVLAEGRFEISRSGNLGGALAAVIAGDGGQGSLTLGADVIAPGGPEGSSDVILAGCNVVIRDGVTVDARGDFSTIEIASGGPLEIGADTRIVAGPTGEIVLVLPPAPPPSIAPDAAIAPLPNFDEALPCDPTTCGNGIVEGTEQCDDGNADETDGCDTECAVQCTTLPAPDCRQPVTSGRATLALRDDRQDARDRLTWRWVKGDATTLADFGDPTTDDSYALCLYDDAALAFEAIAPAGTACGTGACWSPTPRGYAYDDPDRTHDGLDRIELEAGAAGEASVIAAARGSTLALPALPLALPVRAQLQGSHGACWEAAHSAANRNDQSRFESVAD